MASDAEKQYIEDRLVKTHVLHEKIRAKNVLRKKISLEKCHLSFRGKGWHIFVQMIRKNNIESYSTHETNPRKRTFRKIGGGVTR